VWKHLLYIFHINIKVILLKNEFMHKKYRFDIEIQTTAPESGPESLSGLS
jgi:hypothetical protein